MKNNHTVYRSAYETIRQCFHKHGVYTVTIALMAGMIVLFCAVCFAEEEFCIQQGMYQTFVRNDKVGLRDVSGNELIPAEFTGISPVQDGFCVVQDGSNYGVWSVDGHAVLPAEYSDVTIEEPYWLLDCDQRTVLYDPAADEIISDFYDHIWARGDMSYYMFYDRDAMGLLDLHGNVILCDYLQVSYPVNYIVRCADEEKGVLYYSIKDENFFDECFTSGSDFSSGRAVVYDSKYGAWIINEEGDRVSSYFDYANFSSLYEPENTFACEIKGKWYIRNLRQPEENLSGPYDNEPFHIGKDFYEIIEEDGLIIYAAAGDKELFLDGGIHASFFFDDHAIITYETDDGRQIYGYLFDDMQVILPLYDDASFYVGEYALVKRNGSWYAIDREGTEVIRQDDDYTRVDNDDWYHCLVGERDGKCFYLNQELDPITIFEFWGRWKEIG